MIANGHSQASRYPLCRLWNEAAIVRRRIGEQVALETTMLHTAVAAIISGKPHTLKRKLKELSGG